MQFDCHKTIENHFVDCYQYTLEFNGKYQNFDSNYESEDTDNIKKCFAIYKAKNKPALKP